MAVVFVWLRHTYDDAQSVPLKKIVFFVGFKSFVGFSLGNFIEIIVLQSVKMVNKLSVTLNVGDLLK